MSCSTKNSSGEVEKVLLVNPKNTAITCPSCHSISKETEKLKVSVCAKCS